MTPFPRPARLSGVLAVLLVGGWSARADQIDLALVKDSAEVAKAVRDLGAKSVAVLKFQVAVGSAAPTFSAGTLGGDMAQRVENLLLLTSNPDAPEFDLLTGAGEAAAKKARSDKEAFDWTTPAGRAKLFGLQLPVAWDAKREAAPDGFVTGTVRVAADHKTLSVELVGFTKADPAALRTLRTLRTVEPIRTDRSVLTALGKSFAVPTRVVTARGGDLRVVNEIAAAEVRERAESKAADVPGPVRLQFFYDDAEVKPAPGPDGEFRVPTPKAGQSVKFRMTNVGPDPVAALLTVNGKNTLALNGKTEDLAAPSARPDQFQLWVLEEPNKPYAVNGFLTSLDGKHQPFQVLSEPDSVRAFNALSPTYAGRVQLTVYGKKPALAAPVAGEKPTLKDELAPVAVAATADKPAAPEKPAAPDKPATPKSDDPAGPGPKTLRADEEGVRELNDGHAAGALTVRLQLGESGDLAKAQFAMKRGLGINSKKDGSLYLPPRTLGMVEAGAEEGGIGTRRVSFARDKSPIANVVIAYYNPGEQ
jgi:hypothetical protein